MPTDKRNLVDDSVLLWCHPDGLFNQTICSRQPCIPSGNVSCKEQSAKITQHHGFAVVFSPTYEGISVSIIIHPDLIFINYWTVSLNVVPSDLLIRCAERRSVRQLTCSSRQYSRNRISTEVATNEASLAYPNKFTTFTYSSSVSIFPSICVERENSCQRLQTEEDSVINHTSVI
jgi:hypothetical protein